MVNKVVIACDDSPHSRIALDTAMQSSLLKGPAEIHLLSVLPPISASVAYPVTPLVPMASTGAVASVQRSVAHQQHVEKERATEILTLATDLLVNDYKVPRQTIHSHMLPAIGGASGVSDSIVDFTSKQGAALLVVGSRGMGAFKRSMMSLFGLGSVSDAVLMDSNLHCPILLVKHHPEGTPAKPSDLPPPPTIPESKRVCVAYDNSPPSQLALTWALKTLIMPKDSLHVMVASAPVPFPVLDEPATAAAMESRVYADEMESAKAVAKGFLDQAVQICDKHGFPRDQIKATILQSAGGPSDAGTSLVNYARENAAHVLVVGNRGLGSWRSSLMSFVGLGSVSQHLAHNLECAIAIIKQPPHTPGPASQENAPHAAPRTEQDTKTD